MSTDKRRFPEASSTGGVGLLNMHEYDLRKVLGLTSLNSSNAGLVVSSAQCIGIFRILPFTPAVSSDRSSFLSVSQSLMEPPGVTWVCHLS